MNCCEAQAWSRPRSTSSSTLRPPLSSSCEWLRSLESTQRSVCTWARGVSEKEDYYLEFYYLNDESSSSSVSNFLRLHLRILRTGFVLPREYSFTTVLMPVYLGGGRWDSGASSVSVRNFMHSLALNFITNIILAWASSIESTPSIIIIIQKTNGSTKMPHLHNCYFHDHNTITHFCTKPECTLPMCQKCLPIHLQEHSTANQGEGIISFGEAEDRAIKGLKGLLAGQAALKAQSLTKIEDIRGRAIQAISELFARAKNQVEEECACVAEIQKKLTKIQKGSLKTLIYFFTEQQKSIDKSALELKLSRLEQIQKSLMSVMSGETKGEVKQELYQRVQSYENQGRQRGFSTDTVVKRVEIVRSSSQQRIENTQVHSHNHRAFENEAHLKLRTEASFKALPTINAFQPSDNKFSVQASKLDSESERQKEIQSIRVREEQKQRERDQKAELERKEKDRIDREREAERERERQMEKERKEREMVLMRVQQHRTTQTQRKNQQFTQMFQKQSNRNYERSSSYTRMESEAVRKPLQISDLNIETKFNAYAKSSAQFPQYENKLPSDNLPISKQVLSPEEIRKMLEKRIEERSRLISKNKSVTLLKNTEQSITKSYNRSKEVSPGYGQESEGRWDTKDSIINQIYDDYRY